MADCGLNVFWQIPYLFYLKSMDKNNVITKYTLKITQNFSTLSVIRCLYGLDSKFIFNVNRFKLFVADHGITCMCKLPLDICNFECLLD